MDKTEQLLYDLACKENAEFPYNIQIAGYTAFNFVRRQCRIEYLKEKGKDFTDLTAGVNYAKVLFSIFQSLCQILKILFVRPKYSNVFLAFSRLDLVGKYYCDKFTDPFIELSSVGDDYIIFENGRGGVHYSNRIHKNKIINTDLVTFLSRFLSIIGARFYYRRYKVDFDELIKCTQNIYGDKIATSKLIISNVYKGIIVCNLTQKLLKAVDAQRLFTPTRKTNIFMAAKKMGVKCYEMQHGITYGETIPYSGFVEESASPDFFLEFGNNKPRDVYGITPEKMINVGWPLIDFIKKQNCFESFRKKDVLIISDPDVTDKMLAATSLLAVQYPESVFYFRPHPQEKINEQHMNIISAHSNIRLQDNRLNIMMVIYAFDNIVGENSTVLYEALSIGKKVGKLYLSQLNPRYLVKEDKSLFWEIRKTADLKYMLDGVVKNKPHKSIYSPFNKVLFDSLLNS